jgi:hypothetical protein
MTEVLILIDPLAFLSLLRVQVTSLGDPSFCPQLSFSLFRAGAQKSSQQSLALIADIGVILPDLEFDLEEGLPST